MAEQKRSFKRPERSLKYRKRFLIAVEGQKTESQYFNMFNNKKAIITVKCINNGCGSSPLDVLTIMKQRLVKENLGSSDEAWLVVDKDQWKEEQLNKLHEWAKSQENYGFALSNPKFEYWLLLHFEDCGVDSPNKCDEKLKRHIPNYNKGIDTHKFTDERICDAIRRAKSRDVPPCEDWPKNSCGTTVYRLVEKLTNCD